MLMHTYGSVVASPVQLKGRVGQRERAGGGIGVVGAEVTESCPLTRDHVDLPTSQVPKNAGIAMQAVTTDNVIPPDR